MAVLFISHSWKDEAATKRLCNRLRAEGMEALFVDFDPDQGIPAGRKWEQELYTQIQKADAIVFLSSRASVASKWCFAEIALARLLRKPVFPIVIDAGARHPLLSDTQEIDLVREGDGGLEQLWVGLREAGLDPHDSFAWDSTRPAFPGLGPFTEQDAAVFFGRKAETERLLGLLHSTLDNQGSLMVLVGPSGCGKSSLVRAGLLPRLARLSSWLVIPPLNPGSQPTRQLARSLASAFRQVGTDAEPARLAAQLAGGVPVLVELVEQLRDARTGESPAVLLVIDQFEELLTLTGSVERGAFLDLLHGVVHTTTNVWVIATLRSEFLSSLLQSPMPPELLDNVVPLGPLDRARLFAVVERPAARAGLQFDLGLSGRLVEDAKGGDALPLLAFTLRQLADQAGPEGRVTTAAYEALGGVVGALHTQADQTAKLLARSGYGESVVRTLTRLAAVTDDGEPIRRSIPRSELTNTEDRIIQAFIDARLLTSKTDGRMGAVVEVAHEALLRQWPPLRQAIEEHRDELHLRAQLERWIRDWERSDHQDSYLISGERLENMQRWADGHPEELQRLSGGREFLTRSARQHQVSIQRGSETLADRALAALDRDPELGTLLAIAAVEEYGATARAMFALSAALGVSYTRLVLRGHEKVVRDVAFSPDGARLATAAEDGTARVWDATSGAELLILHRVGKVGEVVFSPDGVRLVTADTRIVRVWDAVSGVALLTLRHPGAVRGMCFSSDGARLATAAERSARVWDAASGDRLLTLHHEDLVLGVAFSPDGDRLATASQDRTAGIWDTASGAQLALLRHRHAVRGLAFSPDGRHLVTVSSGMARVWDVASGTYLYGLRGHRGQVWKAVFSPDGARLATASEDRTARIWDTTTGKELVALPHRWTPVGEAVFSPDGTRLVTVSKKLATSRRPWVPALHNEVRVWEGTSDAELATLRHEEDVTSIALSPDSARLATACANTVRMWIPGTDAAMLRLRGHYAGVRGIVFSPDGGRVATIGGDTVARVWSAANGTELLVVEHGDRVLGIAFSPDGLRLATVSWNQGVHTWYAATAVELLTIRGRHRFNGVVFSPDGTRLATAGEDGMARVWDSASGIELSSLPHKAAVTDVVFSPDGTRLATATQDYDARIWDVAGNNELLILREGMPQTVAFSPDGNSLATAGRDRTARLWSVMDGTEVLRLQHDGPVRSAVFSADGVQLATASGDMARVWNAIGGTELFTLRHPGTVEGIAFSPDGTRLAAAGSGPWDHTAQIWDLTGSTHLLAKARLRVDRELSIEERRRVGLLL